MYRHAYRNFLATRRAFLRQSAAAAGLAAASPALLSALGSGRVSAADGAAYADELWTKTKEGLAGGDYRKELNVHAWEGYTEEPVLDPFSEQTGASVNAQMLISDPAAVNNLRGGGTSTWDIINLNNAWQRKELYPEHLITPLDIAKFEPLYAMNTKGFGWPYHWTMDQSGEHLLGMIQRYGPSAMAVNTDAMSAETLESGGYMEMIEGAAGQYGILDYENWVIMHTCMASGFTPFRKHTPEEMAAYEENIFKLFKNAKKVSDDQAALARDMITGEIVGTFPGSVYTVSAARNEGETQIVAVVPKDGIEETKTADLPDGKSGIIWIEVTSLVANPNPTPLAEAFLIYCHTPEASYRVATQSPGTLNPVVQMGSKEVLDRFTSDELEAIQWGEDGSELDKLVSRCVDFDINPDYDAMHDLYTQAKRSRGA
ncbi:MAG: PotD/PotF family extracellular solute-binding protein [Pseudomonadota bacterium]